MDRRKFIVATGTAGLGTVASSLHAETAHADKTDVASEFTAGSGPEGPALRGSPVVSGPSHESITILQPLQRHATGFLEFAIDDGEFQRVDADDAGLQPFEQHVLKFRLPPLPAGRRIRYRVTARTVGWVQVRTIFHGKIIAGLPEVGPTFSFKTLNPASESTTFVVWNDTHERPKTLESLHSRTAKIQPDFLLWNGDQTNDVHFQDKMAGQVLAPNELDIANKWPLAYVRGNHDVRGPAARHLREFTGTPDDKFYYAFRSGPVAGLVLDTGEDKPDDHPGLAGLTVFDRLRAQQAEWLGSVIQEPWFLEAPFKVLFCHIPIWWVRERKDVRGWWEICKLSRDAWLPQLLEGGVDLVISGHTHESKWMPASDTQPIAQLIGGGPSAKYATLIQGTATASELKVTMSRTTSGKVVNDLTFATKS